MPDDLMILAFDHRTTIKDKIFHVKKRVLSKREVRTIKEFKNIIYAGLKKAISFGVDRKKVAVLCDEDFGSVVLKKAKKDKIMILLPVERSGSKIFFFNFHNYMDHINKFKPDYVKVLIFLNPETKISNIITLRNLKVLYDHLKKAKKKLLVEVLITPTPQQLKKYGKDFFDRNIRPKHTLWAVSEIYRMKIYPYIWKLEGYYNRSNVKKVSRAVKGTKIVILGRSESMSQVLEWIRIGAKTKNVIGFAVGRTIFIDAIKAYYNKRISKAQVIDIIARRYKKIADFYLKQKYQ